MAPTLWPRVLIDADVPAGTFTWDSSSWDGGDTWGASPDYVQVPDADIRRVSVRRGGRRWQYDTGEAVIVFDNRQGNYDPADHSGAYGPRLRRGMLVQVQARSQDTYDNPLLTGRLVDVQVTPDPIAPTVTWIVEDALAELGRHPLTAPAGAVDTCSVIAGDVLEEARVAASVTSGGRQVRRASGLSARQMLDRLAVSEAGRFFVGRDGGAVLQLRVDEVSKSPVLTLAASGETSTYAALRLSPGFSQVTNAVTVRRDGVDDVTRFNSPSEAEYGLGSVQVDAALDSDADAAELAQFLADYDSQPARLVDEVSCRPATWSGYDPVIATLVELGDVVDVELPDGGSQRGTVERIAWDFDASGVSLSLGLDRYDPAGYGNAEWFVWDSSSWDDGSLWSAF